jgi:hypothetical protein
VTQLVSKRHKNSVGSATTLASHSGFLRKEHGGQTRLNYTWTYQRSDPTRHKESNCPLLFWDYCVERRARINNLTAKDTFKLHGRNAHTAMTSEEGDISNLCQYIWYQWCYFHDQTEKDPFNREILGRVLGPGKGKGNEMAHWILKANGNVVPRRSQRPLKVDELHSPTEMKKREIFDGLIERRWGTSIKPLTISDNDNDLTVYEDDDEEARVVPDIEDSVDATGKLLNQQPAYNRILHSEVSLQLGEDTTTGKVIQRAVGPDGTTAGTYDSNPYLNLMIYEVELGSASKKLLYSKTILRLLKTLMTIDIIAAPGTLHTIQPRARFHCS